MTPIESLNCSRSSASLPGETRVKSWQGLIQAKRRLIQRAAQTASLGAAAIVFGVVVSACHSEANAAADEQAIRDADERYNAAIVQRDLDAIMRFYAPNAVSMSPGDPPEHGLDQIRAAWKPLLATPGFKLRIVPEKIDVSRAGDMALELGHTDVEGTLSIGS